MQLFKIAAYQLILLLTILLSQIRLFNVGTYFFQICIPSDGKNKKYIVMEKYQKSNKN